MRVRSMRRAPALAPPAPATARDPPLPSSFVALLHAVEAVSSTSAPPPAPSAQDNDDTDAKLAARRARNRIACRKARLSRKLRRLGEALRVRQREQWRAFLLDLRDDVARASPGPGTAALQRAFLARSLHISLVDAEYLASKQSARGHVAGWPTRKAFAAMERQWKQLAGGLMNVDLAVQTTREMSAARDGPSTVVLECEWTLSGVSESILATHARIETKMFRGITTVRFVDDRVTTIELSAAEAELLDFESSGSDGESEDFGND